VYCLPKYSACSSGFETFRGALVSGLLGGVACGSLTFDCGSPTFSFGAVAVDSCLAFAVASRLALLVALLVETWSCDCFFESLDIPLALSLAVCSFSTFTRAVKASLHTCG